MNTPQGPALVWCPFPDESSAADVARALLDERLIACANILPPMRSLYVWRGERGESAEVGVLFKTDAALLPALQARIPALHPYDEPAVLGWACDMAAPATRDWLGGLLTGG
ncbi:divalent cation tolerance protein CutA [Novosphingobium sp. FSY-8]|uniref:Divalent cation tolerance protein CutA n=1 Tax=Novosphingobium ovatum TaxID=1908523 RepID=A0ABW9XHE6_9SPHN|nr:divalent-cation tolerance protein CutA [Novosphingobium ovatum]NBC37898.1 divalent cation tolerance protein CutA [Novosphingobium ovatum]